MCSPCRFFYVENPCSQKTVCSPCPRLVLAVLDCTLWPSDASYLKQALHTFTAIINMAGRHNAGLVYVPVLTSASTQKTVLNHRRLLEDALGTQGLDVLNVCSLAFIKQGSHASDKRKSLHHVLFVTSTAEQSQNIWTGSNAWNSQNIGPVPLIRVSDMLGYDSDARPGPSQRVEQNLVRNSLPCIVCVNIVRVCVLLFNVLLIFFWWTPVSTTIRSCSCQTS